MKIVIIDEFRTTKYNLPNEVRDFFLFPYQVNGVTDLRHINIESHKGKWIFRSNGEVNLINDGFVKPFVVLEEGMFYRIQIAFTSITAYLYCAPSMDEYIGPYDVHDFNMITIGRTQNNMICYSNMSISENHAVIEVNNGVAQIYVLNPSFPVYVNGFRVVRQLLLLGDVIFINGLKIIWMGNFIKVNHMNGMVNVNGLIHYSYPVETTVKYEPQKMNLSDIELYKPTDFFYHTPRIQQQTEEDVVEIDLPPSSQMTEPTASWIAIGTSVTMASSSLVMMYSIYSSVENGNKSGIAIALQVVSCIAMIFASIIMPRFIDKYNKNKQLAKEALRQRKYKEYIRSKEFEIQNKIKAQIQLLNEKYLSPNYCPNVIATRNARFWERKIVDLDFLVLNIGYGSIGSNIEIEVAKKTFSLENDELENLAYSLVDRYKYLEKVPICMELPKSSICAITGIKIENYDYIDSVMLQLVTFHSASELKILFFTDDYGKRRFDYVKYLPHVWSEEKDVRFFSSTIEDSKTILDHVDDIFSARIKTLKGNDETKEDDPTKINLNEEYKNFDNYYLIVTNNFNSIRENQLIQKILKSSVNYGFSILAFEETMNELPGECTNFAYLNGNNSCLFYKEDDKTNQQKFVREKYNPVNMYQISKYLLNIPVEAKDKESQLPTSLTFLEMMNVSKIEQLNLLTRWKENDPTQSLQTPIGVHKNGDTFFLNLHEKAHGPHGLIAGSTGSGKSEFIITLVLSLAINFNPEEVQFVLIDYKGGGLAGAFENREKGYKIPHLAGTITNLDTVTMNRALVSINSELKRRQKKFNEVRDSLGEGTIDIYKYQRLYRDGVIKDPISHLFIICDEFAELKAQKPEFMDELISTSRIGRSLGVHLILATQKPTGVVNDQIWANSKFKICLKVQDKSDSMGMLKKPDAASIKETGRFYLQVGYDEYYDIGQSGWSGAKYIPTDVIKKKLDDSLTFINSIGYATKSVNDEISLNKNVAANGDQLTNSVKYIIDFFNSSNYKSSTLWLDNIPAEIFYNDLLKKYGFSTKPYEITALIGEYDYPQNQEQGKLVLDFTNNGNTLIYGIQGSGKENLIYTIVTGISMSHSPEEVNFYLLDFGAETLKMFAKFPHVGDVSLLDDQEKIMKTFILLDEEMDKRKEMFADYAGSYINFCKVSPKKLPLIITIINNYEVFAETYGKLAELIQSLIRDGAKYGIIFIITTVSTNSIRSRMQQNFNNMISLQLPNDNDYRGLLGCGKGLVPTKVFGRGIAKTDFGFAEFQTAYISEPEKVVDTVKAVRDVLIKKYPNSSAKSIPTLPPVITVDDVKDKITSLDKIPVGINESDREVCFFNFNKNIISSVVANDIGKEIKFINALIRELVMLKDVDVKVIDINNIVKDKIPRMAIAKANFDNVVRELAKEIDNSPNSKLTSIYVFVGIGELKNKLTEEGIGYYNTIFSNAKKFAKTKIIVIDSYSSYKKIQVEPWYSLCIDTSSGIWLGEGISVQLAFNYNTISEDQRKANFEDMAFIIDSSNPLLIKHVVDKKEDVKK